MQDHRTLRLVRLGLAFLGVSMLGFVLAWSFLAYRDPNLVASFASLLQACGISVGR
jgi:Zn-dependent M16 (insulinase) family peptidase